MAGSRAALAILAMALLAGCGGRHGPPPGPDWSKGERTQMTVMLVGDVAQAEAENGAGPLPPLAVDGCSKDSSFAAGNATMNATVRIVRDPAKPLPQRFLVRTVEGTGESRLQVIDIPDNGTVAIAGAYNSSQTLVTFAFGDAKPGPDDYQSQDGWRTDRSLHSSKTWLYSLGASPTWWVHESLTLSQVPAMVLVAEGRGNC